MQNHNIIFYCECYVIINLLNSVIEKNTMDYPFCYIADP